MLWALVSDAAVADDDARATLVAADRRRPPARPPSRRLDGRLEFLDRAHVGCSLLISIGCSRAACTGDRLATCKLLLSREVGKHRRATDPLAYHDPDGRHQRSPRPPSPLAAALERVGDRWSLLLVETLLDGPRRFNELGEALPGIAPNILTDRLRRLEREGIVLGPRPYTERPPRMEYHAHRDGPRPGERAAAARRLGRPAVGSEGGHEPLRHATCGTPLEARWYCPTCTIVVEDREAAEIRTV